MTVLMVGTDEDVDEDASWQCTGVETQAVVQQTVAEPAGHTVYMYDTDPAQISLRLVCL